MKKVSKPKKWKAAPLKGSFMLLAMFGFIASAYLVLPTSPDYGIALMIIFLAMFIAALVSMTKAPLM